MRTLQVLFNLVSNAIKYSPEGTVVVVGVAESDDRVQFEVTDEGVGVPENQRCILFERFTRVHSQESTASGTGIGLHFSKTLIELMDGQIGYRPRPSTPGSVFWFTLPSSPVPALRAEP